MYSMFFLKGKKKKCLGITSCYFFFYLLLRYSLTFTRYMIYCIWHKYPPSNSSCCEEICFSPLGMNHDIMNKELSLVCHMKHSDEKSLETKDLFPLLFVPLFGSVRSSGWSECCAGKIICFLKFLAVLKRIYKLTFNIKLRLTTVTAEGKVNFECSVSRLNLIW